MRTRAGRRAASWPGCCAEMEISVAEQAMDIARTMYDSGISIEIIAKSVKESVKTIERWLGLIPQMY